MSLASQIEPERDYTSYSDCRFKSEKLAQFWKKLRRATERREAFCSQDASTVSNLDIGGSKSFDHNGLQAAVCMASYTDSAQKMPGRVESQMVIAAPGKIHVLTCTVEDEDQETAEYEWATLWGDKVRHIQDSFRLPE